jgi:hypothetical protein
MRGAGMNAHLAEIGRTVAPGAHAILVLDGAGWHGAHGLIVPENLSLLTLPPYAPELNPIENVWAYLRSNKLAITVFHSYDDFVARCCEAWNFFAQDPSAITSITARSWADVVRNRPLYYVSCGSGDFFGTTSFQGLQRAERLGFGS